MNDKLYSCENKCSTINNTLTNMQAAISNLRNENAVMREEIYFFQDMCNVMIPKVDSLISIGKQIFLKAHSR